MKKLLLFLALLVGCLWSQLALAGVYAYITNSGSSDVSVIDTTANPPAVIKTIGVGDGPSGVTVHPNGTRVYVTNSWGDSVSVIDTVTNMLVGTIGPPPFPFDNPSGVAIHPDGTRLYVANPTGVYPPPNGTVAVIDTTTNPPELIKTIEVGKGPAGVAVLPDGSQVYVANATGGSVSVIRTLDNAVVATIPVPGDTPYPEGVAVHPNGTRVYVTVGYTNAVAVIDTTTNPPEVIGNPIPVGLWPSGVAINPLGTRLYVANSDYYDSTVSVIDTTTNPPEVIGDPIPLPAHSKPVGVDVLPDGTRVYVALVNSPYHVAVIDTTTNPPEMVETVTVGTWPVAFGKFIVTTPSPTGPTGVGAANPDTVVPTHQTLLTVTVTPGTIPPSTGLAVTCDLSAIGGSVTQAFSDDGTQGDATAGDNVFSYRATVGAATSDGAKNLACTISDAQTRSGNAAIGLTVDRSATLCYNLGWFDTDLYAFEAVYGEAVTITLAKDAQGVSKGNVAGLYMSPFRNTYLLSDRGALPNTIQKTITFPGTYIIKVANFFTFFDRFIGDYCVTLESDKDAYTTFRRW